MQGFSVLLQTIHLWNITFIIIIEYTQLQFQTKINIILFFLKKYSIIIIELRLLKNIKSHRVSNNTLLRSSRHTFGYEFRIYCKKQILTISVNT